MAEIVSRQGNEIVLQVKVKLEGSMLEQEESIQQAVNELGAAATKEALSCFDTSGAQIKVASISLYCKGKVQKRYETPYGSVDLDRYVYQAAGGGKTYCPLDEKARIITHSTPRLAKMVSHKYARMPAGEVLEDFEVNHGRTVVRSFLQNLAEMVGSIAQATEEEWTYEIPLDKRQEVKTIGLSLDGTCILMQDSGYREAMVGTLSLYDKEGERLHTVYLGAAPEYGKAAFLGRLSKEIERVKQAYPNSIYLGIADGAKVNWDFLEKHSTHQILDFYHATEYLAKVAKAIPGSVSQKKAWLDDACHRLKHDRGSATVLLKEMKLLLTNTLSEEVQNGLASAMTYFTNQKHRMNYAEYSAMNFPIGSGVTEAACKTLVKQRLCRSGMKWKNKGVGVILSLRALVYTKKRFEQFWNRINQTGLMGVI